jgi:hypothetical protein
MHVRFCLRPPHCGAFRLMHDSIPSLNKPYTTPVRGRSCAITGNQSPCTAREATEALAVRKKGVLRWPPQRGDEDD